MLDGLHIKLRILQKSDLKFLENIENNTENWNYGSEKKIFSKKQLVKYIYNANISIKIAKQFRFVIDLERIPIGFIDLFDYTVERASIGVIIAKDFRRRGFAKEALELIIKYGFNVLNLNQLHSSVSENNFASINLFTSSGFTLISSSNCMKYFILNNE